MRNFKILDESIITQSIEILEAEEPAGIRERCTEDHIVERLDGFPHLKVSAVEIFDRGDIP